LLFPANEAPQSDRRCASLQHRLHWNYAVFRSAYAGIECGGEPPIAGEFAKRSS
jgi:hypothetical protein